MIHAVVVLYHPDLELLDRLLTSACGQVNHVVVVDNTSPPTEMPPGFFAKFSCPVSCIPLGDNKGIAEAQNIGIQASISAGCSHVVLLDQDSAVPAGMVQKLLAAERALLVAGQQIAAIGPQYLDEKTGIPSFAVRYRALTVLKIKLDAHSSVPVETDILIASGSVIRTAALQAVGMMRGDLFIDFVDTEWALRARSLGYKCYCVPDVIMMHSIGNAAARVFGKSVYLHSDIRKYYRLRNAAYLLRLPSMGRAWKSYILRWIPYFFLLNLWISTNKLKNARLLFRALYDGVLGKLGPAVEHRDLPDLSLDKTALSIRGER